MTAGTGSEFGLSGDDQIVLVVRHLAEHGGRGQIAEVYDAVESNLAGNMLSEQGRSSLRFFVNEVAVKKGYLQPHDPADPGWHLTEKGWDLAKASPPAVRPSTSGTVPSDAWHRVLPAMLDILRDPEFDKRERDYKLVVAERLRNATETAVRADQVWTEALRDALGPPNNLTNWRVNERLLRWVADPGSTESARRAVAQFADVDRSAEARFDAFAAAAKSQGLTPGAILSLGSLLNFAVEPERLPIMRSQTLGTIRKEVGKDPVSSLPVEGQYREHLNFCEEVNKHLVGAGGTPRDMLDVQSAIYVTVARLAENLGPEKETPAPLDVDFIEAPQEIEAAQKLLAERFGEGATTYTDSSLGFRGGSADGNTLYWHPQLQVWGAFEVLPEQGRFWNPFGTSDPSGGGGLSITCEVNPSLSGINRQVAGAFAIDLDTEHRLLLHRGRIGGGRSGVNRELFWGNTELPAVTTDDGQKFVIVADLDAGDVPAQVARFVYEVSRIKGLAEPDGGIDQPAGGSPGEIVRDLDTIADAVRDEGMVIDDRALRRFHLAVQVRGFVILSGVSGTGKTWLADAYGRATGGEVQVVPVAPNWTTNEDLLGYLNPVTGAYHDTPFSLFVRAAADEWAEAQRDEREARPFFLVLDEMNLARVEYYFAQFLSALEFRARSGEGVLQLGSEEVILGQNLKFVGTVNIDETTHGFADKVYDRAQLIELEASRAALAERLDGKSHADALLDAWDVLHAVAPFAFRVVDEIGAYIDAASDLNVAWADALDEQLLQKVLPKVRGLDPDVGSALEQFIALAEGRYPLSHTKAQAMLDGFNQHRTVSYFG